MDDGFVKENGGMESNSKPFLLKRIISDGFDVVLVFLLFIIFSSVVFSTPLAGAYNTHYDRYKNAEKEAIEEFGEDKQGLTEFLNNDAFYRDERFAAMLHGFLLMSAAGLVAEAIVLLAVPMIVKTRSTPGKLMTGVIPYSEKRQSVVLRRQIVGRFVYILVESLVLYPFTERYTFLLIPVIRLIEMLLNKKNKTFCDFVSGTLIIEKRSYSGIEKLK